MTWLTGQVGMLMLADVAINPPTIAPRGYHWTGTCASTLILFQMRTAGATDA